MPSTRSAVRKNAYVDSVTLLQATAELQSVEGVLEAAMVMATDVNRDLLRDLELLVGDAEMAGATDLVIAVRASDDAVAEQSLKYAEDLIAGRRNTASPGASATAVPRSIRAAHRLEQAANLAVISVPGPFAAAEARQALAEGMHVFLFSDNVSLEDEVGLKQAARELGLLVMGPDCGTAILNGVGLGFANAVRRGRVGLVGASGTGLQELSSLLHEAGEGISHAIGTGGRDLSPSVGGIATLQALELLREDPRTEVIVVVAKAPGPEVAERVLRAAADTRKAVVACLLGFDGLAPAGVELAHNLYQAARLAAPGGRWPALRAEDLARTRRRDQQRQIRGLFCGGTLATEAALTIGGAIEHRIVDFGDDRYTRGRAHPMIDPTLRNQAIVEAGSDARVAALLLDFILGRGSHADPAGAALPAIREAQARATAEGRHLTVLGHVVGTDLDPQNLAAQEARLQAGGVHVFGSNHRAAVAASLLVEGVAA